MVECRLEELQLLGGAIEQALLAEGVAPTPPLEEPESEEPTEAEAVDMHLGQLQEAVKQLILSPLLEGNNQEIEEASPELCQMATLVGELMILLQKAVRLAQVRRQRAQNLECDLVSARASNAGAELSPSDARGDLAEATAAKNLMAARKVIKEKEWELAEVKRRLERLEEDRLSQQQRIRKFETVHTTGAGAGASPSASPPSTGRKENSPSTAAGASPSASPPSSGRKVQWPPTQQRDSSPGSGSEAAAKPAEAPQVVERAAEQTADQAASKAPAPSAGAPEAAPQGAEEAQLTSAGQPGAPGSSERPAAAGAVAYVVDNSQIRSQAKGISFRLSKQLQDKDTSRLAKWGSVVHGVDVGDGWVQVEDGFLPKEIDGMTVIVRQAAAGGGGGAKAAPQRSTGRSKEVPNIGALPGIQEDEAGGHPAQDAAKVHGSRRRGNSNGGIRRSHGEEASSRHSAGGTGRMPLDLRGLSKLLTGNAVKTPRQ